MSDCRCGRETRDDAYVCDQCVSALNRALGDISWLNEELDTTITKQRATTSEGASSRSAEHGLPWHDRAAEAQRNLHALLVSWVRFCDEEKVRGRPNWEPVDRLPSLARWLLHCTAGLSLHDIAPEAVDEITDAVADCERIVFWKRRNRVYLGPCAYEDESECPGDVYADEGAPTGTCEECDRGVTVVIRQSKLDDDLRARLLSAADIADWSVRMGLDAKREDVRKRVLYWHRHKRVIAARTEGTIPLFRYGEVRLLLYAEFAQRDTA